MTTLKIGIATYEEMKARTLAVARGTQRVAADDPRIWFTSIESLALALSGGGLSGGNPSLLRLIVERARSSASEE